MSVCCCCSCCCCCVCEPALLKEPNQCSYQWTQKFMLPVINESSGLKIEFLSMLIKKTWSRTVTSFVELQSLILDTLNTTWTWCRESLVVLLNLWNHQLSGLFSTCYVGWSDRTRSSNQEIEQTLEVVIQNYMRQQKPLLLNKHLIFSLYWQ